MPPNFVKTAAEEKAWDQAKVIAKDTGKLTDGTPIPAQESDWSNRIWSFVVGIWKKIVGRESVVEIRDADYTESLTAQALIQQAMTMPAEDVVDALVRTHENAGLQIRVIVDGRDVSIATTDDVLIDMENEAVQSIQTIVKAVAAYERKTGQDVLGFSGTKSSFFEDMDGWVGPLSELNVLVHRVVGSNDAL